MKLSSAQILKQWETHHRNLLRSVSVNLTESASAKIARIKKLESDPELWFQYYFPNYATAEPTNFHKRATKRIVENKRWFENRRWSRELAKSTRTMMEILYLALVKKEIKNVLHISHSYENSEKLITPYRLNLELNQRIINDYGNQKGIGTWEKGNFITKNNVSFIALGAGQNPRGTKNENHRMDCIIIDDIDTDEECRNEKRVKEKFKWLQEAVIPTVSISGNYRIMMLGNLISKNSCVAMVEKIADFIDTVNIRDRNGKSTWPQKNTEADIDRMLSMLTYSSAQKEYFNNPITEGEVFKSMAYKAIKPLREYKLLVCYTDPSFKDGKNNDFKATVLVGKWKDEFHIIKAFVEQTTIANMIDWHYNIDEYVSGEVPVYYYMESNFIQDSILREFYSQGALRGKIIPIKGDDRKKPDKFTRIEALLEPLNRNGKLWIMKPKRTHTTSLL